MSILLLRIVSKFLSNSIRRIGWLTRNSSSATSSNFKIHLLVVSNPDYAKLAKTCVESFLFFHPKSQVIIHHDDRTKTHLLRHLKALQLFRRGRVIYKKVSEGSAWQMNKLNIILDLNGSKDIFMDCDLRWNGPILDSFDNQQLVYFVEERALSTYIGTNEALTRNVKKFSEVSMKNTSFFSWSGRSLEQSKVSLIVDSWIEFHSISSNFELNGNLSVSRLSEQVVLSIMPEMFDLPCRFLKESDRQFDGSICESSYFGASGGRFALWGNTNRNSLFKAR